ncbi:hypothetical protein [Fodinicola feengrottensis]|uniref:hypothetical protein n=1 Tax=Fodinicola feengrottensis TaxID=435914 RepID=UPI00244346FC|nr:hypothetical protein [Fodinicola feengrottensis]
MPATELQLPLESTQQQVKGLPVGYFVLAGLLVASFDISQQFSSQYPLVGLLPLVIVAAHLTLWFTLLSRRRQYIRAVWRSPRARMLGHTAGRRSRPTPVGPDPADRQRGAAAQLRTLDHGVGPDGADHNRRMV